MPKLEEEINIGLGIIILFGRCWIKARSNSCQVICHNDNRKVLTMSATCRFNGDRLILDEYLCSLNGMMFTGCWTDTHEKLLPLGYIVHGVCVRVLFPVSSCCCTVLSVGLKCYGRNWALFVILVLYYVLNSDAQWRKGLGRNKVLR